MKKLQSNYKLAPFEEEVIRLRLSGWTAKAIALKFGAHPNSASQFLKSRGLELSRAIYSLDHSYFDEIDSEAKAYFVGLLYADGHNAYSCRRKVVRLALQEQDRDILEKLNNELSHTKPIRVIENRRGRCRMAEVEIASARISERLHALGMTPRKSMTLSFPGWLNTDLVRHFIRGYFDGDGCIGCYRTRRHKRPQYRWSMVGTEGFCRKVADILKDVLCVNSYLRARHPERETTTRQLEIGGNRQVRAVLTYLYCGASVYLERKWQVSNGLLSNE